MHKRIHMVGIKGVGMSALAFILKGKGYLVTGSDDSESYVTDTALSNSGIRVFSRFSPLNLKGASRIIFSGAYNAQNNPEVATAISSGIPLSTQQEALSEEVSGKKLIAVAGVGGKTTTSAMLAHIFRKCGRDVGYFVGAGNIGSSPGGSWGTDEFFVSEADEYANNFGIDNTPKLLLMRPQYAVIPNLYFDHPDLYGSPSATEETFRLFLSRIPTRGGIYVSGGDALTRRILSKNKFKAKITTLGGGGEWKLTNFKLKNNSVSADLVGDGQHRITLNLVGTYNLANAALAALVAHDQGIPWDKILSALASFPGVGRRQEYMGSLDSTLLYDDYAHHPHEVKSTIQAFKQQFPERKIWVLFESHTLTRTQKFLDDFSSALSESDQVSIMPIFASAREKADNSNKLEKALVRKILKNGIPANTLDYSQAPAYIKSHISPNHLILTMGAGIVYKLHAKILSEKP